MKVPVYGRVTQTGRVPRGSPGNDERDIEKSKLNVFNNCF